VEAIIRTRKPGSASLQFLGLAAMSAKNISAPANNGQQVQISIRTSFALRDVQSRHLVSTARA
jgi:hypothetical protein